jgi:hypothetical protein
LVAVAVHDHVNNQDNANNNDEVKLVGDGDPNGDGNSKYSDDPACQGSLDCNGEFSDGSPSSIEPLGEPS